ncbi:hypothetical protein [Oceanibaculum pacificum]|uniref:Uncharacterized protein n=1 Tax=Oceanibaculum pacificum TaxID=580166 RepID=A0A154W8K8_9PROT|nr:hypothetical protein [Oceanibaculum pacificum]KZD09826.1 hypothetical protein AUP43_01205 [Oceanibaculum pacificum]
MGDEMNSDRLTVWRLSASYRHLATAARMVALDPNALVLDSGAPALQADMVSARLDCPSFFCSRQQFVLILAELVRDGLSFDVALHEIDRRSGVSVAYATLHPRLDDGTMRLLRGIEPGMAAYMSEMNDNIERVFEQMTRQIGAGPSYGRLQ